MKKLLIWCLLISVPLSVFGQKKKKADEEKDRPLLELKDIWETGLFNPKGVYGIKMLPDGNYARAEYSSKTSSYLILKYGFENEKPMDTIFNANTASGIPSNFNLEDFSVSAKGNYLLLQTNSNAIYRHSKEAQYYVFSIRKRSAKPIYQAKKVFYATFAPTEDRVAFVYNNNVFIQNFKTDAVDQVTKDGEINKVINGKSDWVYEEEFSLVRSFEWSPNGDKLAFYRFDESSVKEYELPLYDSLYPTIYRYKYPVAGESNSIVSVYVYQPSVRKTVKMNLGEQNDQYIPRIKWTSDDNILSVERLNRKQNYLELLFANATDGSIKSLYTERNDKYIDITDNLYFLKDNGFVLSSEKSGWNQLYCFDNKGMQTSVITAPGTDVFNVLTVDEPNRMIYYTAADPLSTSKMIYEVTLDGTGKKLANDEEKGANTAEFSSDKRYYIMTSSATLSPPVYNIYNIAGEFIRTLEDNADLKNTIKEYGFSPKEYMQIPLSDGQSLNAWMIKPYNFNENNKYPVIFSIYGGPGYQTVLNQWGGNLDIWHEYLASKGYVVVSVDNRGSGGRGEAFKKCTYLKLGQLESDDQITAARYFGQLTFVDENRIGIYGWSFGGYMSSLCLMKGADVFKTAVAVAPVTDWRYYDNIYTERYMQTPKENEEGYKNSSVLKYVPQMKGKLLIVHGSFDDNVHPQNTFELMNEMIKENKSYDSEFYPNKNHSIYGGSTRFHLYSRITQFILNNL